MDRFSRLFNWILVASLAFSIVASPVFAQEEEAEEFEGLVKWHMEIEYWVPQPSGLDFMPATEINPDNAYDTRGIYITPSTKDSFRYRGGFELKNNLGEIVLTWSSHQDRRFRSEFRPGSFVYGEALVAPEYAGLFYDGLADAFDSEIYIKTRDLRIDWYREAFSGNRISGKWFVGYRNIDHHRSINADYYALAPGLPPIIDPVDTEYAPLVPGVDSARSFSDVSARGGEIGIEVKMPLMDRKLTAEAGFSMAILRGKASTSYTSLTHFYTIDLPDEDARLLEPPFDEFGWFRDPENPSEPDPYADYISQDSIAIGLRTESESVQNTIMEMYLGLRWNFWKTLELTAGYRVVYYSNVGVDLRPQNVDTTADRIYRDLNLEGYYTGITYRF